jgi:hypothetical protein
MSARVIVQSGISEGASHWIDRPVTRIGSDPRADLCLPSPDIAAHALTLEFRDGGYRVYNRCSRQISIGNRVLPPHAMSAWPAEEILQLDPENRLVLELDEDPTPQPRPVASADDYDEQDHDLGGTVIAEPAADSEDRDEPPLSPGGSKALMQLAVIAICVIGSVLLLMRDRMEPSGPRQRPVFSTVVDHALSSQNTSRELVQRLQHAEAAVIRGDEKTARQRFEALRDDLISQKDDFEKQGRAPELAILHYVEYRLGQLQ